MANLKRFDWKLKLLVCVAVLVGLFAMKFLLEVVFGLDVPRYLSILSGTLVGAALSCWFWRDKFLDTTDPHSTELKTRHTATLISDSDRG